jgi:hypothetical protein
LRLLGRVNVTCLLKAGLCIGAHIKIVPADVAGIVPKTARDIVLPMLFLAKTETPDIKQIIIGDREIGSMPYCGWFAHTVDTPNDVSQPLPTCGLYLNRN